MSKINSSELYDHMRYDVLSSTSTNIIELNQLIYHANWSLEVGPSSGLNFDVLIEKIQGVIDQSGLTHYFDTDAGIFVTWEDWDNDEFNSIVEVQVWEHYLPSSLHPYLNF